MRSVTAAYMLPRQERGYLLRLGAGTKQGVGGGKLEGEELRD